MVSDQFQQWTPTRRRYVATSVVAMLLLCAVGCRGSKEEGSAAGTSVSTAASPVKQIDAEHPEVLLDTNLGKITIRLDAAKAPGTVRNFLNYVGEGFYDNTLMHYVDAGKMVLAGGYSADHKLKPAHGPIRNEAHNGLKNIRGTVAMTRDPSLIDSVTSQFFINLADAPQRDHQGDTADQYGYCVFGEVTDGLDVAEKISQAPTTDMGGDLVKTPEPAVVITSARIIK